MASSPRLWLVVNGKVAHDDALRVGVTSLRERGLDVAVRVTWESGDGRRLAGDGVEAGADVIVACGGDGTVGEVAAGILDRSDASSPSLAIVPMGTANDFAAAAGIPTDDVETALGLAVDGRVSTIDVGRVDGRPFVNAATGGFGASVTADTPASLKRILGDVAYLITGLTRFGDLRPETGRIHGDGLEFEGDFWGLAVCNGPWVGPQIAIRPDARIDDGELDVLVLPRLEEEGRRRAFERFREAGFAAFGDETITGRVSWLEIDLEAPINLNLDGEPVEGRSFRIEVDHAALRCAMPAGPTTSGRAPA